MKRVDFTNKKLNFKGSETSYEDWKNKFKDETGKNVEDIV